MQLAHELQKRYLVKSLTYRIAAVIVLAVVAYYVTGNGYDTIIITVVAQAAKTLLYYLHERLWAHITWGLF